MLDEKDLQAIAQLISASEVRMTTLIKDEVGASEARMTEKISASEARMMALMEAYFEPRFNLLGDQLQLLHEKMPQVEALESLETRVSALEVAVKRHTEEIKQLKKAQ